MFIFGLQLPFVQTVLILEERGFLQLQNSIKYHLPAILMCTGDYTKRKAFSQLLH